MITSLALSTLLWPADIDRHCFMPEEPLRRGAQIIGMAEDVNGNFLYCEIFTRQDQTTLEVSYIYKEQIIARKAIHFTDNQFTPEIMQIDNRSGEQREAIITPTSILLRYQPNATKKITEIEISKDEVDVIDAGFNQFIQAHWEELINGKLLKLHFASIPHQKNLSLRVSRKTPEKCSIDDGDHFCFWVDIDNSLLRLLIGNIKLTYDKHHRLEKFQGIVNLQNSVFENQNAIIHYFYREDYEPDNHQN